MENGIGGENVKAEGEREETNTELWICRRVPKVRTLNNGTEQMIGKETKEIR